MELAPEPSHGSVTWSSPYTVDPVDVPLADKVALLADWSGRLLAADQVDHVTAHVLAVTEDTYYADLAGTEATQRRVRVHPVVEALALDADNGFETMRTVACRATGGTGMASWPPSPACWGTRSGPRRWRPDSTTSSSTPPTSG